MKNHRIKIHQQSIFSFPIGRQQWRRRRQQRRRRRRRQSRQCLERWSQRWLPRRQRQQQRQWLIMQTCIKAFFIKVMHNQSSMNMKISLIGFDWSHVLQPMTAWTLIIRAGVWSQPKTGKGIHLTMSYHTESSVSKWYSFKFQELLLYDKSVHRTRSRFKISA